MSSTRAASLLVLIFAMCLPGFAESTKPVFRIEPIPFPPDDSVRAITSYDLNDAGLVVGACQIGSGAHGIRPFRASIEDGFIQLPHPMDSTQSRAVAVNARGQIVGWEMTGSGVYAPATPIAWSRNGSLRRLPGRHGDKVMPVDINKSGVMAGTWASGSEEKGWIAGPDGTVHLIGGLVSDDSNPADINDLGWVVGSSLARTPSGRLARHAFLWRPELGMVDIGVDLGGEWSSGATAINSKGTIIGHYYDDSHGAQAFVWSADTGLVPLFNDETAESWAFDINDNHWITGLRDGKGFIRTPQHGAMAIDELIDPEDPNLVRVGALSPGAINGLGQILAATMVDGRPWVVLLTPIGSSPAAVVEQRRSTIRRQ